MTNLPRFRHLLWLLSSFLLLVIAHSLGTAAALSPTAAISQTYETTNTNITQGALVSLATSGSSTVIPANSTNVARLVGITASHPLVELSGNGTSKGSVSTLQVVVSGTAQALVSDVNGPVTVGDKITASPVSGVGMRAVDSAEIVGTAQADLSTATSVQKTVAGTDGKSVTIHIGLLPIAVGVAYYSATTSSGTVSSFVPPFLQTIANSLTGKQVSPIRVLIGATALLLGFIAVTVMLYTSIKSGVISIGRNPLAEGALRKGLVDVIIAAIGVLIITLVLVYGVLLS